VPEGVGTELLQAGARLAGHTSLVDIRTFKLEAECKVVPPPDRRLGFDFEFEVLDSELDEDSLTAACGCQVDLFLVADDDLDDDEESRTEVGQLTVILGALFEVRTPEAGEFTPAEIDAFCETTVRLALYPYARAAVADLTGRLGLPHLTLPTLKIALPAPGKKGRGKKSLVSAKP
jgi:hypothetical protein